MISNVSHNEGDRNVIGTHDYLIFVDGLFILFLGFLFGDFYLFYLWNQVRLLGRSW